MKASAQIADKTKYTVQNDVNTSNCVQVTTIDLNFYQLWCLFGQYPKVYNNGKTGYLNGLKLYEYAIVSSRGNVYTIYAWGTKILDVKRWMIASDCREQTEIQNFLENLFEALKCYSKYYRSIEHSVFESEFPEIDAHMKELESELSEMMGECTI